MTGLATASGTPDYRGSLIPEIWSGKMLVEHYESTALSEIANTEYEGEINSKGDTVHITGLPDIQIKDWVKGQDLVYEQPEPNTVDLVVDKAKYWGFSLDDATKKQSHLAFSDAWTAHAGKKTARTMERGVYQDVYADADTYNAGNSAGKISGNRKLGALGGANGANHVGLTTGTSTTGNTRNILDFVVDCGIVLDEQNVPEEDRYMVLPAWAIGLIATSDMKNVYVTGDDKSPLREKKNAKGALYGFKLYQSNMLYSHADSTSTSTTPTVTHAIFGQKSALTWASNLVKNEGPMRIPQAFGDYYRGLNVYGYEVIKPTAFGTAVIRPKSSSDT